MHAIPPRSHPFAADLELAWQVPGRDDITVIVTATGGVVDASGTPDHPCARRMDRRVGQG